MPLGVLTAKTTRVLMRLAIAAVALTPSYVISTSAWAQDYPSKPIRLVVPYSPGGANDTVARLLGQKMSESVGQTVVIDNKPGASGMGRGICQWLNWPIPCLPDRQPG